MPRRPRPLDDSQVVDVLAQPGTEAGPAPVIGEPDDVPTLDEPEPYPDVPPLYQDPPPYPEPTPRFPVVEPGARPVPESQLSPEQRRIRELEDRLAQEMGRKDPDPELEVAPADGSNILIHFLEDGFTALGTVWYRGQELEVAPGSPAYRDTCDRRGRSWLELRNDEFGQVEKYGKVMFRSGPWPGKSLLDAATVPYQSLKPLKTDGGAPVRPPTEAELAVAQKAEVRRRRAAPRLPTR